MIIKPRCSTKKSKRHIEWCMTIFIEILYYHNGMDLNLANLICRSDFETQKQKNPQGSGRSLLSDTIQGMTTGQVQSLCQLRHFIIYWNCKYTSAYIKTNFRATKTMRTIRCFPYFISNLNKRHQVMRWWQWFSLQGTKTAMINCN